MATRSVLIIGANGGIGLNLAQEFKARGWSVSGTVRPQSKDDPSVKELEQLADKVVYLDLVNETSFPEAVSQYGADKPLDLLLTCAGVGLPPLTWSEHSSQDLIDKFRINCVGPFLASKYFMPALQRSPAGRIIHFTSNLGTLQENTHGRHLAYRISKCALNQMAVTMARELRRDGSRVTVNCIHPGFIATKMSGFKGSDDMDETVKRIVDTIDALPPVDTGRYFDNNGRDMNF